MPSIHLPHSAHLVNPQAALEYLCILRTLNIAINLAECGVHIPHAIWKKEDAINKTKKLSIPCKSNEKLSY